MSQGIKETYHLLHEQLAATEDFEQLWQRLHQLLAEYGITSVFYGFSHTEKVRNFADFFQTLQLTVSHPSDFMQHMEATCSWEDDVSLLHVQRSDEPLLWYDLDYLRRAMTNRQLRIAFEAWDYHMHVGVTLPLRFSQGESMCLGGFGLASGCLEGQEFNRLWAEHDQEIIQLTTIFDMLARERHNDEIFQLTPREKECLKWLTAGLRPQQISDKLGNAYRTTEKQIASARRKLNARSNEQAVAKALVYGVLDL